MAEMNQRIRSNLDRMMASKHFENPQPHHKSKRRLAQKAGMTEWSVYRLGHFDTKSKAHVNLRHLMAVATALECSWQDLLVDY